MNSASTVTRAPRPGRPRPSARNRQLVCAFLLLATIPIGILWRMAPLHLPPFAFKYGGSALWAIAVYWTVAIFLPHARPARLGLTAALIALAVELFKLVYWAPLDRFRETLPGKLLIGRFFTFGAILAYWLVIAAMTLLDSRFHPGRRS